MKSLCLSLAVLAAGAATAYARDTTAPTCSLTPCAPPDTVVAVPGKTVPVDEPVPCQTEVTADSLAADSLAPGAKAEGAPMRSIYCHPYSMTYNKPDWDRLWTNTAVLAGAYVGTLLVLECLPEDATAWNRAEIRNVPMFKRWYHHVIEMGPEWDHDNPVFNFVLHPYAGAAYFMAARSCGFNFWRSLLYSATISTVGWEFGIEAFMERPSIQDIFITPLVGSAIGEMFYKAKRSLVARDYRLLGSPVLGNIAVFLVDPVNEFIDLFRGRNTHCGDTAAATGGSGVSGQLLPYVTGSHTGFSLCVNF